MDAKELVLKELRVLGEQDVDATANTFADDVHLLDVGLQASVNGQEELRASLEALYESIPDLSTTPGRIIGEGNLVAMEYEMTGHHRGEMFGVEPTGKRISWSGFAMFEVDVDAQKIQSETYYYDVESLRAQLTTAVAA